MAKKKTNAGNNGGNNNNNNNNNNSSNNNNSNNNDNKNNNDNDNNNDKNNEKSNNGEYLNVVMKMDLHCVGCSQKTRKTILSFPGVCTVEFEGENSVKIVALKTMDFVKLREKLEKKLIKKVELISPKPPKDQKKDDKNTANDKPKELPMTTVIMKIPYHCYGCGDKTRKAVAAIKGVIEASIDKEKDLVTVKGKVDGKKMVEELRKKLKKTVELVPEKKGQKEKKDGEKDGEKKEGGSGDDGGGGKGGEKGFKIDHYTVGPFGGDGYVHGYGYGYVYGSMGLGHAPQLFSDENPNACSIM